LLECDGKEARTAKFAGIKEIENRKRDLEAVVKEWIRMRDEE